MMQQACGRPGTPGAPVRSNKRASNNNRRKHFNNNKKIHAHHHHGKKLSHTLAEGTKICAPAKEIEEEKIVDQTPVVMECEETATNAVEATKISNCMEALKAQLLEALALEPKYQPNLYLPTCTQVCDSFYYLFKLKSNYIVNITFIIKY